VLCAWVVVVVARSLRGRPSQVKGAFGVADAMALRATLDLRASTAPPGSITGRRGLPSTTRATTTTTHAHSTTTPKNSKDNNTQRPKPPTCARHGPAPSGMTCVDSPNASLSLRGIRHDDCCA
jgi:hypothetical protein